MDRKMFDFNDFRNGTANNGDDNTMPQICFNTDVCNQAPTQSTDGVLTMAFVNMQPLDYVYDEAQAFTSGTLFPNINKPFYYGRNYK